MKKRSIFLYLCLIVFFWAFCFVTLKLWLMPYSVAYAQTGRLTAGYVLYAAFGLLFSTPAPFWSVVILTVFYERRPISIALRRVFRTPDRKKTAVLCGIYCGFTLIYALLFGTSNGSPWYMLPAGFLIMIPFVGIAEEIGWRGYLQPAVERYLPYPFSVLVVGGIWYVWHLDLWLDPTSNHYGDSLIGFGITILIWAFALAALYKATRSVFACAVYHAFVDAIGAVYDWNLLFDPFPGDLAINVFRVLWLGFSVGLWFYAGREKRKTAPDASSDAV